MSESLKYPENKVEAGRKRMEEKYKVFLDKYKEDYLNGIRYDLSVRGLKSIPQPDRDEVVQGIIEFVADCEAQKSGISASKLKKKLTSLYAEFMSAPD